jgi:hypothetical protein
MLKRNVMGVVTAVVVLSAIGFAGASSASAVVFTLTTEACTGGTNVALCYELESKVACTGTTQLCELTGEQSETVVDATGTVVDFNVPLAEILILCETATGSGTILQKEPLVSGAKTTLTGTITYSGCVLDKGPAGCTIKASETTKGLSGSLESESELKLKPATGAVFIEIEFLGASCSLKGKHSVTGTQIVTISNPGTAEKTKTGKAVVKSNLLFLSDPAELEQTLVMSFTGLEDLVDVSKEA